MAGGDRDDHGPAAEVITAAGWVHYDAGRAGEGRRYYADAAQAATAADDGIAAAHALGNASVLLSEWKGGTPAGIRQAVRYAEPASRLESGEIAEGCHVLGENFAGIAQIASTRVRQKLDAIVTTVRPHAQVPEVREFLGLVAGSS